MAVCWSLHGVSARRPYPPRLPSQTQDPKRRRWLISIGFIGRHALAEPAPLCSLDAAQLALDDLLFLHTDDPANPPGLFHARAARRRWANIGQVLETIQSGTRERVH
jgi:hypothetical protein